VASQGQCAQQQPQTIGELKAAIIAKIREIHEDEYV